MDSSTSALCVEYGDNMEGSAFDASSTAPWDLRSLPENSGSVLRHVQHAIPGVTCPMLYHGMICSTFCWHIEDLNLHSVNYHHAGAPKVWYGVAAPHAEALERVMKEQARLRTAANLCVIACTAHVKSNWRLVVRRLYRMCCTMAVIPYDSLLMTRQCTFAAEELALAPPWKALPRPVHAGVCSGGEQAPEAGQV
jgi:JmjC domain, hydroxylase